MLNVGTVAGFSGWLCSCALLGPWQVLASCASPCRGRRSRSRDRLRRRGSSRSRSRRRERHRERSRDRRGSRSRTRGRGDRRHSSRSHSREAARYRSRSHERGRRAGRPEPGRQPSPDRWQHGELARLVPSPCWPARCLSRLRAHCPTLSSCSVLIPCAFGCMNIPVAG